MKRMVCMLGLLVLLPGCLANQGWDKFKGAANDVKALKASDQEQNQRIQNLENVVKDLQSGLKSEIRDQGVKVESASSKGVLVTLPQTVLFSSGSTDIDADGRKILSNLAQVALKVGNSPIRIVGHSDALPVGEVLKSRFADNWELSAARAAAVARVLVWGNDVAQERILVEGHGAANPVADNASEEGREQNRRIEIFIVG